MIEVIGNFLIARGVHLETAGLLARGGLAVLALVVEPARHLPGLILVHPDNLGKVPELHGRRQVHGKIDQIVVEKGYPVLQPMRHGQLVLHDEQSVQESLGLEIE